jgi:hypothetical protein
LAQLFTPKASRTATPMAETVVSSRFMALLLGGCVERS